MRKTLTLGFAGLVLLTACNNNDNAELDKYSKRISELERHIHNLRRARVKSAGKCGLLDNSTDCEQVK